MAERLRLPREELSSRYVSFALAAAAAAVAGAAATASLLRQTRVGCGPAPGTCRDGVGYLIPASAGGGVLALATLAVLALRTGHRADADTLHRMSRHACGWPSPSPRCPLWAGHC